MLKQRREKQQQMELVIMEQMVPEDHFLRKVDRAVDFSFIYDPVSYTHLDVYKRQVHPRQPRTPA